MLTNIHGTYNKPVIMCMCLKNWKTKLTFEKEQPFLRMLDCLVSRRLANFLKFLLWDKEKIRKATNMVYPFSY